MFTDPEKNVWEFGFTPGQHVADFGSGSGQVALTLSRVVGEHGHVYAIDLDDTALIRLKNLDTREGMSNIDCIYGDIEKAGGTHLRDELVDGVVFSNILFQLENPEPAVLEAKRILKNEGRACVIDSEGKFSKEKALELFENAGFKFGRQFESGDHHYGLIFIK